MQIIPAENSIDNTKTLNADSARAFGDVSFVLNWSLRSLPGLCYIEGNF